MPLKKGLVQCVKVICMFLHDFYHEQRILKPGLHSRAAVYGQFRAGHVAAGVAE